MCLSGALLSLYCSTLINAYFEHTWNGIWNFLKFMPYCCQVVTCQLLVMDETGVPCKNHRLTLRHLQLSHRWDSDLVSDESTPIERTFIELCKLLDIQSLNLPQQRYRLPLDCYTTSISATTHLITLHVFEISKYEASVHYSPFSYL